MVNFNQNLFVDKLDIQEISLYHTLLRMRSQIGESIEELDIKIDVTTHSKQSVIKGYISDDFA
jgi:hypothetical protein